MTARGTPAILPRMEGTPLDRVMARKDELGITDAEFARLIGLSHQAFFSWKQRGTVPARHLAKAAQVLKVTTDWIQTGRTQIGVDVALMEAILRAVGQIEAETHPMTAERKAELIALVYDDAARDEGLADKDRIERLMRFID